jgi:glycerol-3-phosphate acyltransferase PlsY
MYASDFIIIGLFSFLVGSIPFGVLLAKWFGLPDPRAIGSGNIGATNMLRTGNKKVALLTLVLDGLKGVVPVLFAAHLLAGPWLASWALLAATAGHCFTPWLKFKGGKGVATALGGVLALNPLMGVSVCAVWLAVAFITRYVSLASVTAGVSIAVFSLFLLGDAATCLLALVGLLILFKHRPNLARLRGGTEPKMGAKKHA